MGLSRYKDWLSEYIYYCSGNEVPQLYNKWVGLGLIASVLKQNVYLPMGDSKLYPNIFIVIVDVAGAGKSHAIENFGLDLLYYADSLKSTTENKIYIYNQKITSASMIKSMSDLYKEKGENCVSVFAEELGFFTNQSGDNSNISDLLIKTFDNALLLANQTIIRGFEGVPRPQLNIIGGTTPRALQDSVKNRFLEDGVVSRIMFVHSEEIGDSRPFPTPPPENETRKAYLAYELNEFKGLGGKEGDKGKFQWTVESREYYEEWYNQTRNNYVVKKDRDNAVLFKRTSNKMLKIAMILSVARKHDLVLELSDIIDAVKFRNEALNNYLYIETKLTTTEYGDKVQKVLDVIKEHKKITHSILQRAVTYYMGSAYELSNAINTLVEAELIEVDTMQTKNAKKKTKIYVFKG